MSLNKQFSTCVFCKKSYEFTGRCEDIQTMILRDRTLHFCRRNDHCVSRAAIMKLCQQIAAVTVGDTPGTGYQMGLWAEEIRDLNRGLFR